MTRQAQEPEHHPSDVKALLIPLSLRFWAAFLGPWRSRELCTFWLFLLLAVCAIALASAGPQPEPSLANIDKRTPQKEKQTRQAPQITDKQRIEESKLRVLVPSLKVDYDPITGSPKHVSSSGFLTETAGGRNAAPANTLINQPGQGDPDAPLKRFLSVHADLFGHGAEILTNNAFVKREVTGLNNGLRTVVWQEQVDGVEIFESLLIAHTSKRGELVSVSSQFVPDPVNAAEKGTPKRAQVLADPPIGVIPAIVHAAASVGERVTRPELQGGVIKFRSLAERKTTFRASELKGIGEARLVWLPLNRNELRLCWEVILTSRTLGEMYRSLVDAQSGEVWVRQCLTAYLSDATYRVYTSDSPSPFSPGLSSPGSFQPMRVAPLLVTLPALDTNASPSGWIDDAVNETRGNNVDAHTDRNADDLPDLPRPQGSPFRVFDYPPDLNQDPTNYGAASVVQLFYECNWMHDRLYQLGFTEAAGNFQNDNFGRGGVENDAVQADAQDGSGVNNANFSTPPDGSAPRMQMYLFNGPTPMRDGALDAEVVLHEYAHGLSNRRVGGGALITALQSSGMSEGWSDFYALSLLSEDGDDVNGNYAMAAYATYQMGGLIQNYYFGIRRYPYSTDMSKNPLTFKDIDPGQANLHSSVPRSPIVGTTANEVHNMGEVWCVALWEARANMINKYGWTNGNQLILQLISDGMDLSPPNPTYLQARDAILQADVVDTGGANQNELWAAFAKRGMGVTATCPANSTTLGIHEAFDIPDALAVMPFMGFIAQGPTGGPFSSNVMVMTLTNVSTNTISWTSANTAAWLDLSQGGGNLDPGGTTNVIVSIDDSATNLAANVYGSMIWFTNLNSTVVQGRQFFLRVGQPDVYTELFDSSLTNDLAFRTFTFTPDGSVSFYSVCEDGASVFPTDPAGGNGASLTDDSFYGVTLGGTNTVSFYGQRTNVFFIGSNGYITFGSGDANWQESLAAHFSQPRISALFHDLNPAAGGTVTWKQLGDRVAVTYLNVPEYVGTSGNNFQIEMFYDGRLRLTWLALNCTNNLVGLSVGQGVPTAFVASDFSGYGFCPPTAPQITSQPTDRAAKIGGSTTISIGAVGTAPMTYLWMKNTSALNDGGRMSGCTTAALTITNLQEADSGNYWVMVTNPYGSSRSSNAMLTVTTVDHFVWGHIPSPQSANVPFVVSLTAQNSNNETVTNFNGTAVLSIDTGIDVLPATSGNFAQGIWTGTVAAAESGTNVVLRAGDGLGHFGTTMLTIADFPVLTSQMYGNTMLLVWAAGAPAMKLETTTNLAAPLWTALPPPVQIGDSFVVPAASGEPKRFFRLHYAP